MKHINLLLTIYEHCNIPLLIRYINIDIFNNLLYIDTVLKQFVIHLYNLPFRV